MLSASCSLAAKKLKKPNRKKLLLKHRLLKKLRRPKLKTLRKKSSKKLPSKLLAPLLTLLQRSLENNKLFSLVKKGCSLSIPFFMP